MQQLMANKQEGQVGVLQQLTVQENIDREEVVNIITDLFLAAADTVSTLSLYKSLFFAAMVDITLRVNLGKFVILEKVVCFSLGMFRIHTDCFVPAQTSHATQWALYLLAKNPDCQERLVEEVEQVLKQSGDSTIEEKHLNQLPYVKGVIKEALRYFTFY